MLAVQGASKGEFYLGNNWLMPGYFVKIPGKVPVFFLSSQHYCVLNLLFCRSQIGSILLHNGECSASTKAASLSCLLQPVRRPERRKPLAGHHWQKEAKTHFPQI